MAGYHRHWWFSATGLAGQAFSPAKLRATGNACPTKTIIGSVPPTRRQFLGALGASVVAAGASAAGSKPMRGVFIIMATPYTEAKAVDYEDLAREVDFMDRSGVHGMVWPQLASEYSKLTKDERMQGMRAIARAAEGKRPALALG